MEAADRNGAHCFEVRKILQEIDPQFDVDFYYPTEEYRITFNGGHFQFVGYNEMDRSVMEHIREVYWLNKTGRVMEDVEKNNEQMELAEAKQEDEFVREMAHQMRKAAVDLKSYGGVDIDPGRSTAGMREEHIQHERDGADG